MKSLRISFLFALISLLLPITPVKAAEKQKFAFLNEKTQFTTLSGDCQQGQGVLKIVGFEGNANIIGTYTGDCKDTRPHGAGELVSPDPVYGFDRIVRGTWNNGSYHGMIAFIYPKALETQVSKEIYTYKDDKRAGTAEVYDGKGCLMLVHEYRDDRIISSIYVDPEGNKTPIEFDPKYISSIISNTDIVLPEYQRTLTRDEYYVQTLTDEQTVQELLQLQPAIDKSLSNYIYIKEKGITLYEPATTGSLNLFSLMHSARLNHLRLDLGRPIPQKYEYGYTAMYLGFTDILHYTPPNKWPSTLVVIDTLKKINVPSNVTDGLIVYLAPFTVHDTNGYYEFDYKTIALFGSGRFPTTAGSSTIAHELGHAVHDRVMVGKDWEDYWSLRSVPPRKSDYYAQVTEAFAEDFRVLYGNSEKTSFMRNGEWRGRYGDIREYPAKRPKVLEFMNKKITNYKRYQNAIVCNEAVYHRVFTPSEVIRVKINQEDSFQAKIIRYQKIPLGDKENYQQKVNTVSFAALVKKGRSYWQMGNEKSEWDKLEILVDGKVTYTFRPGDTILVTIDDVTQKYEGRYITYLEPKSDGPMENFVRMVPVYSEELSPGEMEISLKGYSTGFYQLVVSQGSDDQNSWKYFFVVYAD